MNNGSLSINAFESLPLTPGLIADLQSDHAGEAGAVAIYKGMLAVSRDSAVRRFSMKHIRTELRHLRFFEEWLPKRHHSRLLPVWRGAGWLLGATSALFGRQAAFRTVAAVETFVEEHYLGQIEIMESTKALNPLATILRKFCADEVDHRNDATTRLARTEGAIAGAWAYLIAIGSALGVGIARRI
ncbi:MAG: demethoxyubiquinone hydroxylase family protein [Pseudomonadota bacterium]